MAGLLALLLATPMTGVAAEPESEDALPAAAQIEQASEASAIARRLATHGRWSEAVVYFRRAFELEPSYNHQGNLGLAQLELGQHRDAARNLSASLRFFPDALDEKQRVVKRVVRDKLALARAEVLALTIRVDRAGARVLVDGEEVGISPLPDEIFVDPGPHVVEAEHREQRSAPQSIEGGKGQRLGVVLTIGRGEGDPDTPATETGDAAPALGTMGALAIASGALAAVTLGVATGLWVHGKALGREGTAQSEAIRDELGPNACFEPSEPATATRCRTLKETLAAHDRYANAATGLFITGGVLAATAGALLAVELIRDDEAPVAVSTRLAPGQAAIFVGGRW